MRLVLKIENETSLPDGGPLSVSIQGMRGIDIGRDRHLDWALPDPSRAISGKHCEIRYQDGGYVLHDVSTNGTFLDGKEGRLKGPHRLRNGDRLIIGHYMVGVTIIDGTPDDNGVSAAREVQPTAYSDLWNDSGDAAPPSTGRTCRRRESDLVRNMPTSSFGPPMCRTLRHPRPIRLLRHQTRRQGRLLCQKTISVGPLGPPVPPRLQNQCPPFRNLAAPFRRRTARTPYGCSRSRPPWNHGQRKLLHRQRRAPNMPLSRRLRARATSAIASLRAPVSPRTNSHRRARKNWLKSSAS